jgi:hypothetical protein
MRPLLLVLVLACASFSGCASDQGEVLRTGRSINLYPTQAEINGGYQ